MPQPLSKFRPEASYSVSPESLDKHPELSVLVLKCIAAVSNADHRRGLLLATMLRGDAHIGLAIYMALKSSVAKDAALAAAAEETLDDEGLRVFTALKKKTKAAFNQRNDFAHCVWGHSDDIPDSILMIPTDQMTAFVDERTALYAYSQAALVPREKIMVYRKSDLQAALDRAEQANRLYYEFYNYQFHKRFSEHRIDQPTEMVSEIHSELDRAFDQQYEKLKNELGVK